MRFRLGDLSSELLVLWGSPPHCAHLMRLRSPLERARRDSAGESSPEGSPP